MDWRSVLVTAVFAVGAVFLAAGSITHGDAATILFAIGFVASSVAAALAIVFLVQHFRHSRSPSREQRLAAIRARAAELSTALFQYLSDRRSSNPTNDPHAFAPFPVGGTPEQIRAAREPMDRAIERHTRLTMDGYNTQFRGRALAIIDQLTEMGVTTTESRSEFELPTNPLGLEDIASALSEIAEGGKPDPARRRWVLVSGVPGETSDSPSPSEPKGEG